MKAFVDSREPDEVKLKCAKGNANGEITFNTKELPQADFYLPEEDVAIERKEASDFASSTTDGRLSKQADRMIAKHDHVYVIIERPSEPLYDLPYTNVSENSLVGMQTSLAVKRGIKIIYTESVEQTLYAVNRVFERHLDSEHEEQGGGYVKTADTGEVDDVHVAMLMQIDGISEEKAEAILEQVSFNELGYMTPMDSNDTEASIMRVDGIGPTLAERVISAFQ